MEPITMAAIGATALLLFAGRKKVEKIAANKKGGDESSHEPKVDPNAKKAAEVARKQEQIVSESKEIIHGKRNEYSDDEKARKAAEKKKAAADKEAKRRKEESERRKRESAARQEKQRKEAEAAKKRKQQDAAANAKEKEKEKGRTVVEIGTPVLVSPPGYDRDAAARNAVKVADHIRARGGSYKRDLVREWQKVAGLKQDGIYGRRTRRALLVFKAKAPPVLFAQGVDEYNHDDALMGAYVK